MKSAVDDPGFPPEDTATDLRTDCAIGVMAKSPRAGYSKMRIVRADRMRSPSQKLRVPVRGITVTVRFPCVV